MAATAIVRASIEGVLDTTIDIGRVAHEFTFGPVYPMSDGTGADQVRQVFTDTRTINASSNDDLDLAGSLVNAVGATITFTKLRAILVRAAAGNTNNVVVGGAASNGCVTMFGASTDKIVVRPGGMVLLVANDATGYAVTAGTGDILRIANSGAGTSVAYDIVLLGTA